MIKTVVTASYVHISNLEELIAKKIPQEEQSSFRKLIEDFAKTKDFQIVKYDKGNVTFITSPDWDTADEPIVGTCYRFKKDEWFDIDGNLLTPKETQNFKQIYHNKWQFVSDTYQGFDVEKAKERTKIWNAIPNLDKKRIGYKNYWVQLLSDNNIPLND